MSAAAMQLIRSCQINTEQFHTDCICCRRNFDTFKMVLMREQLRAQVPNSLPGEDVILIYSRPETLSCQDCEDLKLRFDHLLVMLYEIRKDHEGFVILTCKPHAGLFLLKGTAVLNHFFTAEQQAAIKRERVT